MGDASTINVYTGNLQVVVVSPDRIRSEDCCLHYRFMRELLCPPVLGTKDDYWSMVGI